MGEKKGVRENINKMTKVLIEHGHSPDRAREISQNSALRVEHGESRTNIDRDKRGR